MQWSPDQEPVSTAKRRYPGGCGWLGAASDEGMSHGVLVAITSLGRRQVCQLCCPDLLHSVCAQGSLAPLLLAAARCQEQSGAAPACRLVLYHP